MQVEDIRGDRKNDVEEIAAFYAERGIKHNPGYVYILKAENGLYKIGKTKNIKQRLNNIKTSSPVKLEVYSVFSSSDMDDAEQMLHIMFEERRELGEWFRLTESDLNILNESEGGHVLLRCFI